MIVFSGSSVKASWPDPRMRFIDLSIIVVSAYLVNGGPVSDGSW